ncbi:uncharacterized protein LOC100906435 [Galendromus occidentalis]|uniref:Uncharacterized protein LOC100906435 n=1 Tax=Galendromus occidentalis TaxID=34638 RepID=A0AAJ6QPH8_9ACAR|nr:uncharacterized protein LOC100906435 [Galendromus occidentalis]
MLAAEGSDESERSLRIKSLLHELDGLPDTELRDLLLQLKEIRRLRMQSSKRNTAEIPVGQLTENELLQISNSVPQPVRKKPHFIPLDIPHDLIRVKLPKPGDVFGVSRPRGVNKILGDSSEERDDEEKRQDSANNVEEEDDHSIRMGDEFPEALDFDLVD